ncbi:MAG: helix-turn-helix domain-containing protein [Balneolaceae bacterium]
MNHEYSKNPSFEISNFKPVSRYKAHQISEERIQLYKEKHLTKPDESWHIEIKRGVELLNRNLFDTECNVSEIKEMNRTPQKNYSSRFRRCVGMTPREYITQHRIAAAKWLLKDNRLVSLNIGDIGYRVGFERLHSFSMTFKNRTGYWPREWRKRHRLRSEI